MVGPLFTAFAMIAAGQAEAPPISAKDVRLPIAYFETREEHEAGRPARRGGPRPRGRG